MAFISGAVEGASDEAVLRRLVHSLGAEVHRVQVQRGKPGLRRALAGYNAAAQGDPWLVLVDLDDEFDCAPQLVGDWLPSPSRYMCFRVVVREIESWLLADHERFATFFSVPPAMVPRRPDELPEAKEALLKAVAKSRKRAIREDMLPRMGSGRAVGAAYTSRLIEFVGDGRQGWRPEVAARQSPSLRRCVARLGALIGMAP